jgi:acyl carrier protein
MNGEQILAKTTSVFRDVFDDPSVVITRQTTAADIFGWDSLTHINLIVAIEGEFKIKFTLVEIKPLKNVGDMLDLIQSKAP